MRRGAVLTRSAVMMLGLLGLLALGGRADARSRLHFRDPEMETKFQEVFDAQDRLHERYAAQYAAGPVVELVTMGIGSLMWERHGHIALCIRYLNPDDDVCYNYGIGDFHDPIGMAFGFLRGTKSFWVGRQDPLDMFSVYLHFDRTIWVQPLPLDPDQVRAVVAKLEHDVLEENKHYAYDHFWDNCTTRVRDILDTVTHGSFRAMRGNVYGRTYRDLTRDGFAGMTGFGDGRLMMLVTDFVLGRVTDRVPSYWDRMFLPDYFRDAVRVRWGIDPTVVYQRKTGFDTLGGQLEVYAQAFGLPPPRSGSSGRLALLMVILLLTAPAWLTRKWGRFQGLGLAVAIVPPVLLGTAFWFLSAISPLPYLRWNEICLILVPIDLVILFLSEPRRIAYAKARLVMLAAIALLMLVNVLRQPLWMELLWPAIPLAAVVFLRSGRGTATARSVQTAKG